MIARCTIKDLDFINTVSKYQDNYKHLIDDGSPSIDEYSAEEMLSDKRVFYLKATTGDEDIGYFLLVPINCITYDSHVCILPEHKGKKAIGVGKEAIEWMFNNTKCRKIISYIATNKRNVYAYAKSVGFEMEGFCKKSFMYNGKIYDQSLMGINKKEVD